MPLSNRNFTTERTQRFEYRQSFASFAPVSNATYIFSIPGTFGSFVTQRILRIGIGFHSGAQQTIEVQLHKLSTDLTGASRIPNTIVKLDSNNPNNGSTPGKYTSNPTGGGVILGLIRSAMINIPIATATHAAHPEHIFDFVSKYSKGLKLRGTSEIIGLSLLGVSIILPNVVVWVEWVEE